MKTTFRLFLASLLFASFLASPVAKAEIWQSAEVLKQREAAIGGFGQLYFDPSDIMLYGQLLYGIGNNIQLEARLGDGDLEFYAGFFVKTLLTRLNGFDFALWSGLHSQGNAFWDLSTIASRDFGSFELYLAPYISISLGDRNSGVTMNPGLNAKLRSNLSLYGELALKISNIPTSVIGGVRYLF